MNKHVIAGFIKRAQEHGWDDEQIKIALLTVSPHIKLPQIKKPVITAPKLRTPGPIKKPTNLRNPQIDLNKPYDIAEPVITNPTLTKPTIKMPADTKRPTVTKPSVQRPGIGVTLDHHE